MTLRPWTEAEQAQHCADLLAATPHGNKGQSRPRRQHQPTPWQATPSAPVLPDGHIQGDTLEELLAAW